MKAIDIGNIQENLLNERVTDNYYYYVVTYGVIQVDFKWNCEIVKKLKYHNLIQFCYFEILHSIVNHINAKIDLTKI